MNIQEDFVQQLAQMQKDAGPDLDFGRRAEIALCYLRNRRIEEEQMETVLSEVMGLRPPEMLTSFEKKMMKIYGMWFVKPEEVSIEELSHGFPFPHRTPHEEISPDIQASVLADAILNVIVNSDADYHKRIFETVLSKLCTQSSSEMLLNILRKIEEDNQVTDENEEYQRGELQTDVLLRKIASCFEKKILNVKPYAYLYFLLLAMLARRMFKETINLIDFVRLVVKAYPVLLTDGRTDNESHLREISNELLQARMP